MFRKISMVLSILTLGALSIQAATVSGVVKEGDSAGAVVASAIVTLTSTGGGGTTMRDTTGADGTYSFGSVAIGTRQVRAAKTGYLTSAISTIGITDSTATYTQNLFLVSTSIRATVSGTVTDSAAGTPLAGAKILLRIGTGGFGAARDSAVTGANGKYSFDTVPAGSFTLATSATGYISRTITGNITSASPPAFDIKLVKMLFGSITGTVTDSAAATPIAGAKVYLRTTGGGGGTLLDSAITVANGSYTIMNVQTGIARTLNAQASGFIAKNTAVTVVDTAAMTVNIKLVKILFGSITGTVTDSVAATPIAGAKVYLRTTGGGGGTLLDSAITVANGSYTIMNVQTGIARTLNAQASGFIAKNTAVTVVDTAAMTVNIKLVKILFGSITGTVTDSVAGTALAGAKVYLRTTTGGGTILDSATTAANGSYTIANVQAGIARTLRAQDSGFVTKNTAVTVPDTAALTANIQIVKIVNGSITGTVTDSVAGTALAGAKVYLRTTAGGAGGTILDSATTAADGSYTIAHVQSGIARTLRVQDSGYVTKNTTVTVVGTAALTVNVELRKSTVSIWSLSAQANSRAPDFGIARSGLLRLNNFTDAGVVKVFNASGKLLFHCAISDHTTFLTLPKSIAKTGNAVIVSVSQQNATYHKQIMMP
jgi:protocatechuate 3,4-dioxygenase beta subunit